MQSQQNVPYYLKKDGVYICNSRSGFVLCTPQGGKVAVDEVIADLLKLDSNELPIERISTKESILAWQQRAALACLAEAQLLERKGRLPQKFIAPPPLENFPSTSLSAVLVSHDSQAWLEKCLPSLMEQSITPKEVVIVDNASHDGTVAWVKAHYPQVRLIAFQEQRPLAQAINTGIHQCNGEYYLVLNPDVILERRALEHMLRVASADERCAAVAAKLKFLWAPGFINGLGNFVAPQSWGTDIGLGHLDLGQFDHWEEVPSACFAAALISARAWLEVGPLDEGFPMYYEDTEWCYRARLLGYRIRAAPLAEALHAFSGHILSKEEGMISPQKLTWVTYGRLRFASKLMTWKWRARFLGGYAIEDVLRSLYFLFSAHGRHVHALAEAWRKFVASLGEIKELRLALEKRKTAKDQQVFHLWRKIPPPLMWRGMPLLTWDVICYHYLPLILQGKTRPLSEINNADAHQFPVIQKEPLFIRARAIWRNEGFKRLFYHVAKKIQWRLMRL